LSEPPWHALFESQQPAQLAPEHPALLLLPVLDPLPELLPDPPASSAPLPLPPLVLALVYDIESSEPLELVLLLVLDPLPDPLTPEEVEAPVRSHLASFGGAGSPAAHDTAMIPAPSATSFAVPPRTRLCIVRIVRGVRQETRRQSTSRALETQNGYTPVGSLTTFSRVAVPPVLANRPAIQSCPAPVHSTPLRSSARPPPSARSPVRWRPCHRLIAPLRISPMRVR
jgi:hypothetical protein